MDKIVNSFSRAYQSFFMRDILTIMLPGFITLLVVFGNINDSNIRLDLGVNLRMDIGINILTFLLILISFPVGWSQFYCGIKAKIIRQFTDDNFENYFKNELEYYKKVNELAERGVIDRERELLYHERLATVKQLVGSFLFGLIICAFILTLKLLMVGIIYLFIIYYAFVVIGLAFAQDELISRQKRWQESRIGFE